jgi:argininosuccinate lyase
MRSEDNTQQMSSSTSQQIAQLVAAVRSLEDRFETRLANVEEIIVARLGATRPFDHEVLARLNELAAGQAAMQEQMAAMQEQMAAMRSELTALRIDHERFREETNRNFKLVNQMLDHLTGDLLRFRAGHTLLEERVSRLEEQAA